MLFRLFLLIWQMESLMLTTDYAYYELELNPLLVVVSQLVK